MKEFRCTRSDLYSHDCIGHDDITTRQGYYIIAENRHEAIKIMMERFQNETAFTAKEFKHKA